jgi:hypothetical protein
LGISSGSAGSTITGSGFNKILKMAGVGMLDDNDNDNDDDDDDDASVLCSHPCFSFNTFREEAVNFWVGKRCIDTVGSCLTLFGCISGSSVDLRLFPGFWSPVVTGSWLSPNTSIPSST